MTGESFDYTSADTQAMQVDPVVPQEFDLARFEDYAAAADARYAAFLAAPEGVAIWQRVRVAEVFRDGCRDRQDSLRWQLGGLQRALAYATDAPAYLEPWYGIGTTASAFGADYEWPSGQAPVVRPLYKTIPDVPDLVPLAFESVPILRDTLAMIEYFLDQTQGRLPISWSDLQSPLNVAASLIETSGLYLGMAEYPERVQAILEAITSELIDFTARQSWLIGPRLARPGHGFASSRAGTGIGLSNDNLVMISPRMYGRFCAACDGRVGARFGGTAIHSCGNWGRWVPAVRAIPNLTMVDAAFSPQTDPDPNTPEVFRDALANFGVVLQARIVGEPETVLQTVRRLWAPGLKLIVVSYVQDAVAQQQLYRDIHALCS